MSAFRHLDATHLLRDTCSIELYTGQSTDASHVVTDTFGAAASYPCNAIPKNRWDFSGRPPLLTSELDIYLGPDCPVTRQSKLTYGGVPYRVVDVQDWGSGKVALCKRWEQVTV